MTEAVGGVVSVNTGRVKTAREHSPLLSHQLPASLLNDPELLSNKGSRGEVALLRCTCNLSL